MSNDTPPRVGANWPTGTRVYDVADPRHVGRLDAVLWSGNYRVTFDNGTRADIPRPNVRRAQEGV